MDGERKDVSLVRGFGFSFSGPPLAVLRDELSIACRPRPSPAGGRKLLQRRSPLQRGRGRVLAGRKQPNSEPRMSLSTCPRSGTYRGCTPGAAAPPSICFPPRQPGILGSFLCSDPSELGWLPWLPACAACMRVASVCCVCVRVILGKAVACCC